MVYPSPEPPRLQIPKPVFEIPRLEIKYPQFPVQQPAAPSIPLTGPASGVPPERTKEKTEKTRELPSRPQPQPLPPPSVPATPITTPVIDPPPPAINTATKTTTIELMGHELDIPSPRAMSEAAISATLGASVTLVTATLFNFAKKAVGRNIAQARERNFKIKLKQQKPVLHFVMEEGKDVEVIEYSADGVKVVANHVLDPEQYLRQQVNENEFFELDHKIIIDAPLKKLFTKEGVERFNYFLEPGKLAKKLAARFVW